MKELEQLITEVFMATDAHEWETLKKCFTTPFTLDYESMSDQPPSKLTPNQLVESWSNLMPGFDSTHHQIGNIVITKVDSGFHVTCYGTATHYIQDATPQTWSVYGTYEFDICAENQVLQIERMKFRYKFQTGNTNLPTLAIERMKS